MLRDVEDWTIADRADLARAVGTVESRIFRAPALRTLLRPACLCIDPDLLSAQARAQCRLEGTVLSAPALDGSAASGHRSGTENAAHRANGPGGRYSFKDVKAGMRVEIRVIMRAPCCPGLRPGANWVETVDIRSAGSGGAFGRRDLDPPAAPPVKCAAWSAPANSSIAGARVFIADTQVVPPPIRPAGTFSKVRAGLKLQLRVAADSNTDTDDVTVPSGGAADVDFALGLLLGGRSRRRGRPPTDLCGSVLTVRGTPWIGVTTYEGFSQCRSRCSWISVD